MSVYRFIQRLLMILCTCSTSLGHAQTPKQILAAVHQRFDKVNDYSAAIRMVFDLPSVNLQPIKGKVFYKKPTRFRIRAEGIVFMPKENPYQSLAILKDTNSFTAVATGTDQVGAVLTQVIQVIPNGDNDLILGKFWVDKANSLVLKSQLTTKASGTIQIQNTFGTQALLPYALPDLMTLSVDMSKFKVPKMLSVDLNSKSKPKSTEPKKTSGKIMLYFSQYAVNKKLPDAVFTDQKK
jgi:hypothetical protein